MGRELEMFTFLSNLSSGFTSFTALLASFAGPRLQALAASCQNPSCACKSVEFDLGNCTVDDNHQGDMKIITGVTADNPTGWADSLNGHKCGQKLDSCSSSRV